MPTPDFQSTMRPLLARQVHDFNELYAKFVEFSQLVPEEAHARNKSGSIVMFNRVSWPRTFSYITIAICHCAAFALPVHFLYSSHLHRIYA